MVDEKTTFKQKAVSLNRHNKNINISNNLADELFDDITLILYAAINEQCINQQSVNVASAVLDVAHDKGVGNY